MIKLQDLYQQINNFSQIGFSSSEAKSSDSFKDILVEVASRLRGRGISYIFELYSASKPVYRLRSEKKPKNKQKETSIKFSSNKELEVVLAEIDNQVFRGVVEELRLIGEVIFSKKQVSYLTEELNLFKKQPFQQELAAEFHRWDRYDSPFWILRCDLGETSDWREIAQKLKHFAKSKDKIGLLSPDRLVAFFPGLVREAKIIKKITKRLNEYYSSDQLTLTARHIPTELNSWTKIIELIES